MVHVSFYFLSICAMGYEYPLVTVELTSIFDSIKSSSILSLFNFKTLVVVQKLFIGKENTLGDRQFNFFVNRLPSDFFNAYELFVSCLDIIKTILFTTSWNFFRSRSILANASTSYIIQCCAPNRTINFHYSYSQLSSILDHFSITHHNGWKLFHFEKTSL